MSSSLSVNPDVAQLQIEAVQQDDCRDLWLWRNDPLTRVNSLSTDEVSFEQHCKWFNALMSDNSQFLMLGLLPKQSLPEINDKIGMVRFDVVSIIEHKLNTQAPIQRANKAIVSINVNPTFRAKGLSVTLLSNAITSFKKSIDMDCSLSQRNIKYIEATIKEGNKASIKCFEKAGFVQVFSIENQPQDKLIESSQRQYHLIFV